jgi:integral membrane sensor domain MASE1
VYIAYAAVVVAGTLGGIIGIGLVNATCSSQAPKLQRILHFADASYRIPSHSCQVQRAGGLLSGAVIAGIGAGIVAVLVLRAMTDWRTHPPDDELPH